MKNIKRIAYIILIGIIAVLSLTIYTNASKGNEKEQKDKAFSQIKFMEGKISNLLNTINNIEARNYSIITSEMSKETTEKTENKSNSSSGKSEKSGGSDSSSSDSSSNASKKDNKEQSEEKFELKAKGVLTKTEDINWETIKNQVESLYTSLPSITMDLYQQNIKQEDILAFNTQYDKLTSVVKNEKKEETLAELANVYEFFPKFLKGIEQDEIYTTLIETKLNVFKAYSKLDGQDWQQISNDVKNAINTYSKLLTRTDVDEKKQYSISKCYIMLNELQNAVNLNDIAVFLIKYKNLLEEINNM